MNLTLNNLKTKTNRIIYQNGKDFSHLSLIFVSNHLVICF